MLGRLLTPLMVAALLAGTPLAASAADYTIRATANSNENENCATCPLALMTLRRISCQTRHWPNSPESARRGCRL